MEKQGYPPLDEREKVRRFLTGIKTQELDIVKSQVWMAGDTLANNFDVVVDLCKTFLGQTGLNKNNRRQLNISSTFVSRGGYGCGERGRTGRGGQRYTQRGGPSATRGRGRWRGGSGRGGLGGQGYMAPRSTEYINGIDISNRFYEHNEFENIGAAGRVKVKKLCDQRDEVRAKPQTVWGDNKQVTISQVRAMIASAATAATPSQGGGLRGTRK